MSKSKGCCIKLPIGAYYFKREIMVVKNARAITGIGFTASRDAIARKSYINFFLFKHKPCFWIFNLTDNCFVVIIVNCCPAASFNNTNKTHACALCYYIISKFLRWEHKFLPYLLLDLPSNLDCAKTTEERLEVLNITRQGTLMYLVWYYYKNNL